MIIGFSHFRTADSRPRLLAIHAAFEGFRTLVKGGRAAASVIC
jgi:hypothetical protein